MTIRGSCGVLQEAFRIRGVVWPWSLRNPVFCKRGGFFLNAGGEKGNGKIFN